MKLWSGELDVVDWEPAVCGRAASLLFVVYRLLVMCSGARGILSFLLGKKSILENELSLCKYVIL